MNRLKSEEEVNKPSSAGNSGNSITKITITQITAKSWLLRSRKVSRKDVAAGVEQSRLEWACGARGAVVHKYGLSDVKQKLSELVERASRGERIGITVRGKLVAEIVPPPEAVNLKEVFEKMDRIRKRAKPLQGVTIKDLIEEGRR